METALLADFERFVSFSSTQKKFYLFLPLPFREKSERPEKAHSSLYSSAVNLDTLLKSRNIGLKVVFAVMFVYAFAQHKQRSMTLSIILLLWESKPNC